jgi:catechol 2,3-dioxygenase-like lactoylglutathione lyase family enzyme
MTNRAQDARVVGMLSIGVIALGVDDVERAAAFWSEALAYDRRTDGFGGWPAVLEPRGDDAGPKIALQLSATPVQHHPRLHLDLHVSSAAEQSAEIARLLSLGAQHVAWDSYPDDPDFVVLADTEGNRFCIVDLSHQRA